MTEQWDNSYFDGLISSKNITVSYKATSGVMREGELPKEIETNAGREQITVKAGTLRYKPQGSSEWQTIKTGEVFIIPAGTHFLWKVETDEMRYECVYLDKPVD